MNDDMQLLDRSALKFNQIGIVTLSLIGFIFNQPLLPALVSAVLLVGTLDPRLALFKQIYHRLVKPLGLLTPDPAEDVRASHEFAQLLGGVVLLAATIFLWLDWPTTGWALTWVVILLAAANLFFGFCAGCFVYYQLRKLGVPGFVAQRRIGGDDGTGS